MRRVLVGKQFDLTISDESSLLNPSNTIKKHRQSVSVGQEFHIDASLSEKSNDDRVRSRLVWAFIGLSIVFLLGSGMIGLYSGNFSPLATVWGIISPVYGALAGYYFPNRKG